MEISTPYFSHISKYPQVYEPAEDTFLLLDALESDQDFLRKRRFVVYAKIVFQLSFFLTDRFLCLKLE